MIGPIDAGRIDELVRRYGLNADSAPRLAALVLLVAADPHSPTTVRDPPRVIEDHIADSLVALEVEGMAGAKAVADLGSGAGFPGLPLAVAMPTASVALVESNARKCTFLSRAVEVSRLENAVVVNARAEAWSEGLGQFDIVTARALAHPSVVAEYAAPLLRVGGRLIAWRGHREPDAERQAERAAEELSLEPLNPLPVKPYPAAANRYLHVMVKRSETSPRFPRRPGVAVKRPLGR